MSIPAWILDIFAAVMLLVAAVSAGQLVVARAWTRAGARDADIAGSHLLMGIAMAGVLMTSLRTLPNTAWEVIFAAMTAWFAWCLWQETRGRGVSAVASGHHAPHLAHSAAMLYMFAALAGPASGGGSGMAGMAGSAGGVQSLYAPTLAFVFALLLVAYSVRDLDRKADADGYFHVAGRRFMPAGPTLATPAMAVPAGGVPAGGVPAGPTGGGESAVATVAQPQAARAAGVSPDDWVSGRDGEASPLTADRLLLSPAVVKGCRVAMGVTMAFMLIISI
jgi:hypothetical protein